MAFSGLTKPTAVRFSPDGRVFVAEQSGLIKVFDGLDDTHADRSSPTCGPKVHAFWDRGLLGLALHPSFPAKPFVYVSYAHDARDRRDRAALGHSPAQRSTVPDAPRARRPTAVSISGRISRLTADGNTMTGPEQVLVEDWCQQFPSHSVGSLVFGPDGSLYASGGDGASFNAVDYGQFGAPTNPCGDPPGDPGDALSPPTAEGGALRSQDLRTAGDPAGLGRHDHPDRPRDRRGPARQPAARRAPTATSAASSPTGLRNPFRITTRPGTDEVWIGDVGWADVEEINRLPNPTDATVDNFGWPCYEGPGRQRGYDGADLSAVRGALRRAAATRRPSSPTATRTRSCRARSAAIGSSSVTGRGVRPHAGGAYPADV